jgi:hypothetical protein
MPALATLEGNIASTTQEKADALRTRFYPVVEVDLLDIKDRDFADNSFPLNLIQIS